MTQWQIVDLLPHVRDLLMRFVVEFGVGLEALVEGGRKRVELEIPNKTTITCQELITYLSSEVIEGRKNLFVLDSTCFYQMMSSSFVGGTIKPGILVLVNDCDWELVGGATTTLKAGDTIGFISTLHGGWITTPKIWQEVLNRKLLNQKVLNHPLNGWTVFDKLHCCFACVPFRFPVSQKTVPVFYRLLDALLVQYKWLSNQGSRMRRKSRQIPTRLRRGKKEKKIKTLEMRIHLLLTDF